MAMHYWNGSSWAIVNNTLGYPYDDSGALFNVWNGSVWTQATNAKVWNGSTWKGFVDQVQLSDDVAQDAGDGFGGTEVEWAIYSTGSVIFTNGGSYPWIVNPANSGQYSIMVSQSSGDPLEGTSSPLNTPLNLSTTRVWRVFANEFTRSTAFMTATIIHNITGVTVATNSFVLDADTSGIITPF
jgi:hypothetical protein